MMKGIRYRRAARPKTRPWSGWLGFACLCLGLLLTGTPDAQPVDGGLATVLRIDGPIGPATTAYIQKGFSVAAEKNARVVVISMDTPGGLDTAMRDIIRAILTSPVPVITYVNPSGARAASAGTYILYASHIAAMAPGTNLGAATPVAIGGGGGLPLPGGGESPKSDDGKEDGKEDKSKAPSTEDAMKAKAINDAVAYIRSLAELHGRNAEWAEKAVREAASLSSGDALKAGVIDIVSPSLTALLQSVDGRTVNLGEQTVTLETAGLAIEELEPGWRTEFLAAITNPNVALILMMIGVYGLIFEFMNPGAIYPGTIGAICLITGLYALGTLPVNYAGLALILLGFALMIAEAFAPSFGILGIGGIAAFILGTAIMFEADAPGFEISWAIIATIIGASLLFALIVIPMVIAAQRRRVATGREDMLDSIAEVQDWAGESGHVFVHGERWRARGKEPLNPEDKVRVTAVDGLTLHVRPLPSSPSKETDDV